MSETDALISPHWQARPIRHAVHAVMSKSGRFTASIAPGCSWWFYTWTFWLRTPGTKRLDLDVSTCSKAMKFWLNCFLVCVFKLCCFPSFPQADDTVHHRSEVRIAFTLSTLCSLAWAHVQDHRRWSQLSNMKTALSDWKEICQLKFHSFIDVQHTSTVTSQVWRRPSWRLPGCRSSRPRRRIAPSTWRHPDGQWRRPSVVFSGECRKNMGCFWDVFWIWRIIWHEGFNL